MTKFQVSETVACWVTFTRSVEAETKEEAVAIYSEGEGEPEEAPEIGESIDGYDCIIEVDGEPFTASEVQP